MQVRDQSTVYFYAVTLCMGSFVFGYQLSCFGPLVPWLIQSNSLSSSQSVGGLSSYFNLLLAGSAIVGVVFFNYVKHYGWQLTFRITDWLTIIAGILGATALSVGVQSCSRVIFGVVTGINTILIPLFLASILPGSMAAPAGTLNQVFIVLGAFTGELMGAFLVEGQQYSEAWRLILALPIVPALIRQYYLSHYFPYETLQTYIQNDQRDMLEHYLKRIYQNVSVQQFIEAKHLTEQDLKEEKSSFMAAGNTYYRIRMSVAIAMVVLNQYSGLTAFFVHLQRQGHPLSTFLSLNALQLAVTLFAGQLLQRWGRRAFMQEGQRLIVLSLLLFGVVNVFVPDLQALSLGLVFVHMVGYSLSYGPCTFLIATEVVVDVFYPALIQWGVIFLNEGALVSWVGRLGMGSVCLFCGAIQLWGYVYLQSFYVQTAGKPRSRVCQEYRSQKYIKHGRGGVKKVTWHSPLAEVCQSDHSCLQL